MQTHTGDLALNDIEAQHAISCRGWCKQPQSVRPALFNLMLTSRHAQLPAPPGKILFTWEGDWRELERVGGAASTCCCMADVRGSCHEL